MLVRYSVTVVLPHPNLNTTAAAPIKALNHYSSNLLGMAVVGTLYYKLVNMQEL